MSVFSLSGKTALVAGASRGIGLAIAQHLAEAGAHTTLAARSVDKLRGTRGRRWRPKATGQARCAWI